MTDEARLAKIIRVTGPPKPWMTASSDILWVLDLAEECLRLRKEVDFFRSMLGDWLEEEGSAAPKQVKEVARRCAELAIGNQGSGIVSRTDYYFVGRTDAATEIRREFHLTKE